MIRFLSFCGRHGRVCLVGGLVMGIALPDLALAMRPRIAPMVVLLLFLAVLRLGPEGIRAGLHGIRGAIGAVLVFQMVAPLMAVAGFAALGWLGQASKAPIGMTISRPDPDGKEAVPVRRLFQRPVLMIAVKPLFHSNFTGGAGHSLMGTRKVGGGTETTVEQALMRGLDTA